MKDLKGFLTEGLLQFAILLSLGGTRVEFDPYLPPLQGVFLGASSAYFPTPFHRQPDAWEESGQNPKSADLDSYYSARRLLKRVRTLGRGAYIPTTQVDIWLVHGVPAHTEQVLSHPFLEEVSNSEDPGHQDDSGSQVPASNSEYQESTTTNQAQHLARANTNTNQATNPARIIMHQHLAFYAENRGQHSVRNRDNQGLAHANEIQQHTTRSNENQGQQHHNTIGIEPNSARRNDDQGQQRANVNGIQEQHCVSSASESQSNMWLDEHPGHHPARYNINHSVPYASSSTMGVGHLSTKNNGNPEQHPAGRMEHKPSRISEPTSHHPSRNSEMQATRTLACEDISSEYNQPVTSSFTRANPSDLYSVNFNQAISHDVSLRDAALVRTNHIPRRNLAELGMQPLGTLPNLSINQEDAGTEANLADLFSDFGNDLLSDLDESLFDEIDLRSLALDLPQLFDQPEPDSRLSLNSSHSTNSLSTFHAALSCTSVGDEGLRFNDSDSEFASFDGLEGAVGRHWPDHNTSSCFGYGRDSRSWDEQTPQHVRHNHTYSLLSNPLQHGSEEDQCVPAKSSNTNSGYASSMDANQNRDEHHAKALKIPFPVHEMVNMPIDVFNSMLSKHYLTATQISVIRDIRRRGKNKLAAHNCRKRKLDVILSLEDDICVLAAQRENLLREKALCNKSVGIMKQKLDSLYHAIFRSLRDDRGKPVSPSQCILHCNADGSILVIPRRLYKSGYDKDNQKEKNKE
ncbi:nuclear factor erythroid 2-related factor 3 [Ambystoma mexicanum]|uniref:nuclear factor erythroid 2-related factor 3 n=1 Tax=Ambystoma mexicanum TaxID=8296 RepID=UPI0037E72898